MYSKAAILALVSCLLATQAENDTSPSPSPVAVKDAAEIIANNDDFSILNDFVTEWNLTKALQGNVTVFAPTNKAFEALNKTLNGGLNITVNITDRLMYHVVGMFVDYPFSGNNTELVTLEGNNVTLTTADNTTWEVNLVKIDSNTPADDNNGMVFEIDAVLEIPGDVSSALSLAGGFSAAAALLVSLALMC